MLAAAFVVLAICLFWTHASSLRAFCAMRFAVAI